MFILMKAIFYGKQFQAFIASVIIFNAAIIGLQTFPEITAVFGSLLQQLDSGILLIFTLELLCRLYYERTAFFRSGWNWFDLIIVVSGYLPDNESFTVCRLFRIMRLFRLFSVVPQLRIIVDAMLNSIPSLGWVVALAIILNYAFAVIGFNLYGRDFPNYFGDLPRSMYTMFEMMTRAGWHILTRSVTEKHPDFYVFIIPYILVTSYVILNLIMGVIVNSMRTSQTAAAEKNRLDRALLEQQQTQAILDEIHRIKGKVARLEQTQQNVNKPAP